MQQAFVSQHTLHTCINISIRAFTAAVRHDKACRVPVQSQVEHFAPPQPKYVMRMSCCPVWQFTIDQ